MSRRNLKVSRTFRLHRSECLSLVLIRDGLRMPTETSALALAIVFTSLVVEQPLKARRTKLVKELHRLARTFHLDHQYPGDSILVACTPSLT